MNDLSPTQKLSNLIAILEVKQRIEYNELKDQFEITIDSIIRPESILTNVFAAFAPTAENKSGILNSILGLVTEFVSKKIIANKSNDLFKKFAGFGIQYIIHKFLSKK